MCRVASPSPTRASTITSVSTTATSIPPSRRPSHQRASHTPPTHRYTLTPSAKSPFFTRLEEEHDASSASIDTDSASARPPRLTPSLHASTLSSESTSTLRPPHRRLRQPRRPLSTPPPPPQPLQRAHRSTSHSITASAWKQWSKRTCTNSDSESILSEPASYSRSAYVANGMWIVQHDASTAERELTRRRQQRAAQRANRLRSLQPSFETRVKPRAYACDLYQEEEADSSQLLSQFFSGQISPSMAPNNVRAMSEFERVAPSSRRMAPEGAAGTRAHTNDYYAGAMGGNAPHHVHDSTFGERYRGMGLDAKGYFEAKGSCRATRRFSPRRLRWWFRKWSHKMRGQWEYNF